MARAAGSRAQSPGPTCDLHSCVPTPAACVWAWGWQPALALVVTCSQQGLDFSPRLARARARRSWSLRDPLQPQELPAHPKTGQRAGGRWLWMGPSRSVGRGSAVPLGPPCYLRVCHLHARLGWFPLPGTVLRHSFKTHLRVNRSVPADVNPASTASGEPRVGGGHCTLIPPCTPGAALGALRLTGLAPCLGLRDSQSAPGQISKPKLLAHFKDGVSLAFSWGIFRVLGL